MGHKHSRPVIPVYQKVESIFEDIGCSGFTDIDYYGYDRLDKAPFLNYKIRSVNYAELKQQITDILANLPDALGINEDTNITKINLGDTTGSGVGSFNILGGINFGYNPNLVGVLGTYEPYVWLYSLIVIMSLGNKARVIVSDGASVLTV